MIHKVFDRKWSHYDTWFETNRLIYLSELDTLNKLMPNGVALEIGVGTGRFASPLKVKFGIDPSIPMLKLAQQRGIKVVVGVGEQLPFKEASFEFILLIVTLCFVANPAQVLCEAQRVIKPKGYIIVGIIDRNSAWGKFYESKKLESNFYHIAQFYSPSEVIRMLKDAGFKNIDAYQTLLSKPTTIKAKEKPILGFGKGGFVAIRAQNQ
jgi:ubiquinone/menaquinone biosynthesis C-methylase UbiE